MNPIRARWLWSLMLAVPCPAAVDFRQIASVLEGRCQMCHGAKQQMSGLRLDSSAAALKGGAGGPAIVPRSAASSRLLERITSSKSGFRMPPVGAPLTAAEIAAFKEWIDSGAEWPANYKPGQSAGHWSFQPIRDPRPPVVRNTAWVRSPIDQFVLGRLETEGIAPSAEASKTVLLRRVSLDLTGLPPAPDEVRRFLSDTSDNAYPEAVERLLASRHYGEKWARHWLDLARYADSDGYEKDQVRPYAWRYRQWLIDALNRDIPFDQFTIEQLAGDLLPNATVEQHVATGFHRNTLTNREAGVDRAEARFEQLVNRVNTTGTTWLALTIGCSQCHDHKYDPIRQRDFYRMFAFFDGAEETEIEAPLAGERQAYQAALPSYLARRGHLLEQHGVAALQRQFEKKLLFSIDNPGKDVEWDFAVTGLRALFDYAERVLRTPPEKRSLRDQQRLTEYFVTRPGPDIDRDPQLKAAVREVRDRLLEFDAELPQFTMAAAFIPAPAYSHSNVRIKGDYRALGEAVEAGPPAFLPGAMEGKASRLHLARWLVSRENPLTARVAVNRAWQEFFGRGIVATSEDFGTQGERPSNPDLLDWLATRFMEDGWSMKKLHRRIVLSATYRQSSNTRPDLSSKDPANTLLARQSRVRLPAELIRDSALAASGLLDRRIGGPSVRPYLPPGVVELGYAGSIKWKESEGPDRYRRGLYVHFQRTTPYPQLMNFDAPDSNVACSRRRPSNTPLQSLNLLNDPAFFEAAQALAARVRSESSTFAGRLEHAFILTAGRQPSSAERERLAKLHDQQLGILRAEPGAAAELAPDRTPAAEQADAAAWVAVCRVLLNLDEFINRE